MRIEKIICDKCSNSIEVINHLLDEWYEYGEDNTMCVVICDNCKTKNAVYRQSTTNFYGREADKEDLKNFGDDII